MLSPTVTSQSQLCVQTSPYYRIAPDARGIGYAWHVIAARTIPAGARVLSIEGVECEAPTRHSIQFGDALHVTPHAGLEDGCDTAPQCEGHYGWRYLDHACAPNCALVGRSLVALRDIAEGETISFDYETTEHTISAPFQCDCGACGGRMIVGYALRDTANSRAAQR